MPDEVVEDQLSAALGRQTKQMTDAEYLDGIRRLRRQGNSIQEAKEQMDFWKGFPVTHIEEA